MSPRKPATTRTAPPELYPIGPDIDLDEEEVYLADGTRLTEARAEQLAGEILDRHYPGRRSLTGGREHTPSLTVRVTATTRKALEAIAAKQGRRLSDVSRDALEAYIDGGTVLLVAPRRRSMEEVVASVPPIEPAASERRTKAVDVRPAQAGRSDGWSFSELVPAPSEVGSSPKSAIAVPLAAADVERLKARADEERVGFTQLACRWILERLDEESELPAEAEAAIATLRSYISRGYLAEATEGKRAQEQTRAKVTKATEVSKAGRPALSKATGATGPRRPGTRKQAPTRH
jgi:hypothetical protein